MQRKERVRKLLGMLLIGILLVDIVFLMFQLAQQHDKRCNDAHCTVCLLMQEGRQNVESLPGIPYPCLSCAILVVIVVYLQNAYGTRLLRQTPVTDKVRMNP